MCRCPTYSLFIQLLIDISANSISLLLSIVQQLVQVSLWQDMEFFGYMSRGVVHSYEERTPYSLLVSMHMQISAIIMETSIDFSQNKTKTISPSYIYLVCSLVFVTSILTQVKHLWLTSKCSDFSSTRLTLINMKKLETIVGKHFLFFPFSLFY